MIELILIDNLLSLFNFGFNTTKHDRSGKRSVETEKYQIIFLKYFTTKMMKHFRLIFSMKYFFVYFCSCIFPGVFGQDFLCGTSQLIHRIAFLEFFKLGRTQIDSEFNYSLSPSVMCFIKVNLLSVFGVQSLSHIRLFTAPWTAACQSPLS